ncbi:DUF4397 domain-containing protein [Pedobacter sp. MC2016-24]|uniref:DUF4397 domain-containing protein n=1 Tax=Pedobacter sp. MC2016-24 TaxID=2780090 RepID=UPI00187F49BE|nr:DUF4397 domain-containing protein [Pedobacter sp. MC2016-24]MBE9598547.1 DUF4397 domain-containing protein [Pedobacter sp. MC2016-24]
MSLLFISACLCLSVAVSCKKELSPENVTSLTIINALPGNRFMLADLSGKSTDESITGGLALYYGVYDPNTRLSVTAGEQPMAFYKSPVLTGDKPLYQLSLNPKGGEITTLFLTGTQSHPEHFVVNDKPPFYSVKDSLVGLRLINLSAGSGPLQVKISGQGLNTVVMSNNLAYKSFTTYLPVAATSKVGDLLVEFFDQATGDLVASYPLPGVGAVLTDNPWRYHNYTLALIGLPNAAGTADAQGVLKIYDF